MASSKMPSETALVDLFRSLRTDDGFKFDLEDFVDIQWLTQRKVILRSRQKLVMPASQTQALIEAPDSISNQLINSRFWGEKASKPATPVGPATSRDKAPIAAPPVVSESKPAVLPGATEPNIEDKVGFPFSAPAPDWLPNELGLAKAEKPLVKRVDSLNSLELDLAATIRAADETGGLVIPRLKAAKVRELDAVVILDGSPSMAVWLETSKRLFAQLQCHPAFESVRSYSLFSEKGLFDGLNLKERSGSGKRVPWLSTNRETVIFFVSDCLGAWWEGHKEIDPKTLFYDLGKLNNAYPVLVQVMPRSAWHKTLLRNQVRWTTSRRFTRNRQWIDHGAASESPGIGKSLTGGQGGLVPIIGLNESDFLDFAKGFRGDKTWVPGCYPALLQRNASNRSVKAAQDQTGTMLIAAFDRLASPKARKWLRLFSAAPLEFAVMLTIMREYVDPNPAAREPDNCRKSLALTVVAEIVNSGLFKSRGRQGSYDWFRPDIRDQLWSELSNEEVYAVGHALDCYLHKELGYKGGIQAYLLDDHGTYPINPSARKIADVHLAVLKSKGLESPAFRPTTIDFVVQDMCWFDNGNRLAVRSEDGKISVLEWRKMSETASREHEQIWANPTQSKVLSRKSFAERDLPFYIHDDEGILSLETGANVADYVVRGSFSAFDMQGSFDIALAAEGKDVFDLEGLHEPFTVRYNHHTPIKGLAIKNSSLVFAIADSEGVVTLMQSHRHSRNAISGAEPNDRSEGNASPTTGVLRSVSVGASGPVAWDSNRKILAVQEESGSLIFLRGDDLSRLTGGPVIEGPGVFAWHPKYAILAATIADGQTIRLFRMDELLKEASIELEPSTHRVLEGQIIAVFGEGPWDELQENGALVQRFAGPEDLESLALVNTPIPYAVIAGSYKGARRLSAFRRVFANVELRIDYRPGVRAIGGWTFASNTAELITCLTRSEFPPIISEDILNKLSSLASPHWKPDPNRYALIFGDLSWREDIARVVAATGREIVYCGGTSFDNRSVLTEIQNREGEWLVIVAGHAANDFANLTSHSGRPRNAWGRFIEDLVWSLGNDTILLLGAKVPDGDEWWLRQGLFIYGGKKFYGEKWLQSLLSVCLSGGRSGVSRKSLRSALAVENMRIIDTNKSTTRFVGEFRSGQIKAALSDEEGLTGEIGWIDPRQVAEFDRGYLDGLGCHANIAADISDIPRGPVIVVDDEFASSREDDARTIVYKLPSKRLSQELGEKQSPKRSRGASKVRK